MELFLKRFLFIDQAFADEVRKRGSVNPSTQRILVELAREDTTLSGRRFKSA